MTHTLTIGVANLKGGVGKSLLACNLAATLHSAGHRVLLVDTDSQSTCRTWAGIASEAGRDGPPVVSIDGRSLRRDLGRVATGVDVVVIDTAPKLGTEMSAVMLAADLVLLPVVPGAENLWALRQTLEVFEAAHDPRPELRCGVILNRATRSTLTSLTRDHLDTLAVPVLAELGDRVAFGEAVARGQGVTAYAPGSKAAEEMKSLVKKVLKSFKTEGRASWSQRKAS